jgi:hypothetical protein
MSPRPSPLWNNVWFPGVNKEKGLFVGLKTVPYLTTASAQNFHGDKIIRMREEKEESGYDRDAKSWEH